MAREGCVKNGKAGYKSSTGRCVVGSGAKTKTGGKSSRVGQASATRRGKK